MWIGGSRIPLTLADDEGSVSRPLCERLRASSFGFQSLRQTAGLHRAEEKEMENGQCRDHVLYIFYTNHFRSGESWPHNKSNFRQFIGFDITRTEQSLIALQPSRPTQCLPPSSHRHTLLSSSPTTASISLYVLRTTSSENMGNG